MRRAIHGPAAVLAACAALALGACGEKEEPDLSTVPEATETQPGQQPVPTETAPATTTTQPTNPDRPKAKPAP